MIAFALFSLAILLAAYFFYFACEAKNGFWHRLFSLLLSLFFFTCTSLLFINSRTLFPDDLVSLAIIFGPCLLMTGILFYRRKTGKKSHPVLKCCTFFIYIILVLATLAFSFFTRYGQESPIVKIHFTGVGKEERVAWKNPQGPAQDTLLKTYQIGLESVEGAPLGQFVLYGDLVGVRAKVIRFHPLLQAIGFRNLAAIDMIHNGYADSSSYESQPTVAYGLNHRSWHSWFWGKWEKLFWNHETFFSLNAPRLNLSISPFTTTRATRPKEL